MRERRRPARAGALIGGAVCAALLSAGLSPAWAEGGGDSTAAPVVGGFGLGDGLEGLIDPQTGAFSFDLPLGPVQLRWDSRLGVVDRFGLGDGWVIAGVGFIDVVGGVRVFPTTGGAYEANASTSTGLDGYPSDDVRFDQVPGRVPARADGLVGERGYAYSLTELGGTSVMFDDAGFPLTKFDVHGNRFDWVWGDDADHRLQRVVDQIGVATALDWSAADRVVAQSRAGTSTAVVSASAELGDDGVSAVIDPAGGRVSVQYGVDGLISGIDGVSGASTEVSWQQLSDATVAVDEVRVLDGSSSEQLSARSWDVVAGVASGWPIRSVVPQPGAVAGGAGYRTVMGDGASRVESEYDGQNRLVGRALTVTTSSGERVAQEQRYGYEAAHPDRPVSASVTHRDASGGERTAVDEFAYDEFGRQIGRVGHDGTTTTIEFDATVPPGAGVPVGLPVLERTVASDGSVTESRAELNEARTAVVARESFTAPAPDEPLTRTGRVEYEVASDGFVTAERVFPQGGTGEPVVTEHAKQVDLVAGTVTMTDTMTETTAAGTPLTLTSTTVSDLLHGGMLSQTDALGNVATAKYDSLGRIVATTDPSGNTTTTSYRTRRAHGVNAIVVTTPAAEHAEPAQPGEDPAAIVSTEEHDALGRPVRALDNIDHGVAITGHERVVERLEYPDPSTVRTTDAWGAKTEAVQDALGRPVRAEAATGLTEITMHDDVANTVTTALTPTGDLADAEVTTTTRADPETRTASTTGHRADGVPVPETSVTTDGFGRQTVIQGATTTTRLAYDAQGNPVTSEITPSEAGPPIRASRTFDAFGVSTEKVMSAGDEVQRTGGARELDRLGRVIAETAPDGVLTRYEYTPDGLVARRIDDTGRVTTNTYDPVTRALTETETVSATGTQLRSAIEYDRVTGAVVAVYDPADRARTQIRTEYDAWGNVTATVYPDGRQVSHEFDAHGRPVSTTDVAGATTIRRYTDAGLLAEVAQVDRDGRPTARVAYEYDAFGRVARLERESGLVTEYGYTSASQIASERTTRADASLHAERVYEYARTGNLTRRIDTTHDPDTDALTTTRTEYAYDAHNRLTVSARFADMEAPHPVQRVEYEHDASGNVTLERDVADAGTPAERARVREFRYGAGSELTQIDIVHADGTRTSAAQTYDAAGNLTLAADGTRYEYDPLDRPVRQTTAQGEVIDTRYWADGTRAARSSTEPAGRTRSTVFYWSGETLVNEAHRITEPGDEPGAAADVMTGYLVGATRHARTVDGSIEADGAGYYTHDRHGNVTAVTDGGGELTARYDYSDYGVVTVGPAAGAAGDPAYQPFQYSGEYTDPDGTQHLRERTMRPTSMQFTSRDRAQLHNPYWYGDSNPIMYVDPSGRTVSPDSVFNGVVTGLGVLMFAATIGLAVFTGGLSLASIGVIGGIGLAADAYGTMVGVGGLLAEHVPGFVEDHFEAFVTSDAAMWSETVLAIGAFALGVAAARLYGARKLAADAQRRQDALAQSMQDEFHAGAKEHLARQIAREKAELAAQQAAQVAAELAVKKAAKQKAKKEARKAAREAARKAEQDELTRLEAVRAERQKRLDDAVVVYNTQADAADQILMQARESVAEFRVQWAQVARIVEQMFIGAGVSRPGSAIIRRITFGWADGIGADVWARGSQIPLDTMRGLGSSMRTIKKLGAFVPRGHEKLIKRLGEPPELLERLRYE